MRNHQLDQVRRLGKLVATKIPEKGVVPNHGRIGILYSKLQDSDASVRMDACDPVLDSFVKMPMKLKHMLLVRLALVGGH